MASISNIIYIESSSPETEKKKKTAGEEAKDAMEEYDEYLNDLYDCIPDAYKKLRMFMKMGNCRCYHKGENGNNMLCRCGKSSTTGQSCTCPNAKNCDKYCCGGDGGCKIREVEDTVRIYDINPKAEKFKDFLKRHEYHIGRS
jgi:hypothetical protein